MQDSARYRETADDMLRRARMAFTASERGSYMELASGWRKLEVEARSFELKAADENPGLPAARRP